MNNRRESSHHRQPSSEDHENIGSLLESSAFRAAPVAGATFVLAACASFHVAAAVQDAGHVAPAVAAPAATAPVAAPAVAAPFAEAAPLPVAVAMSDAKLRLSGRFDLREKAGPRFAWSAASVSLKFRGTDLNVRFNEAGSNRWQIEIDGVASQKLSLQDGEHLYRVAQNLTPGAHVVHLMKATEAIFGETQITGFQISRGGALLPFPIPKHRLEVIGDSISAGYGNEAANKEEHFSASTENAYFTYGAIAARELNAEYGCVAWSGKKMWPDNTLPELYDRALPSDGGSHWDFSRQPPDAVVINLATNDFNGGIPDEAGWTQAYEAFIARARSHYPNAEILCAIGPMMGDWGQNKPLMTLRAYMARIVADVAAKGDKRVRIIDFGIQNGDLGFGADWHPNIKNHQLMADQLAKTLREDLKW